MMGNVGTVEFVCFFGGISFCQNAGAPAARRFAPGRSGEGSESDMDSGLAAEPVIGPDSVAAPGNDRKAWNTTMKDWVAYYDSDHSLYANAYPLHVHSPRL